MPRWSPDREALSHRLRQVRHECYGPEGVEQLAAELDLPAGTWRNYEAGVTIPGPQLLGFILKTRVHPDWLLTGTGDRFLVDPSSRPFRRGGDDTLLSSALDGEKA